MKSFFKNSRVLVNQRSSLEKRGKEGCCLAVATALAAVAVAQAIVYWSGTVSPTDSRLDVAVDGE